MAIKFSIGAPVRQIVTPIEGVVTKATIIDNDVQYCVEYIDPADGQTHERFFVEADIEARAVVL
jgi:hypothetical protein